MKRVALVAALVMVVGLVGPAGAWAAPSPSTSSVGAHWTPERMKAAIPRDFAIDGRGLAYERRPDGTLVPHGHQVPPGPGARALPAKAPATRPTAARGNETTGPVVSSLDPVPGATITAFPDTFGATVTDASRVKSVAFVLTSGAYTQSFPASRGTGDRWTVTFASLSAGSWSWHVVATDNTRNHNTTTTSPTGFTVEIAPPPSGVVTNAKYTGGGTVQQAAGRLYFEMPANRKRTRWLGYVCSGTVAGDSTASVSIVLTAAHCVYDDVNKAFARNVMFIPDQAESTAPTDRDCGNDPFGCWVPKAGVVDVNWTTRVFPDNVAWDYGYYAFAVTGAHLGTPADESLEVAAGSLPVQFGSAPTAGDFTFALGYSYNVDPDLMYCAEGLRAYDAADWWLGSCGLAGGASGGPWVQAAATTGPGSGPIMSVNSWGYTNQPGMAGPKLNGTSAQCVFSQAQASTADLAASCP